MLSEARAKSRGGLSALDLPFNAVRALSDRFQGLGRNRRVPPALLDEEPFITRF
jgi:hypothetical protein